MRSRALRRLSAERLPLISVIRGWDVKVGLAQNEPSESELTVPGNEGLCECVSSGRRLSASWHTGHSIRAALRFAFSSACLHFMLLPVHEISTGKLGRLSRVFVVSTRGC